MYDVLLTWASTLYILNHFRVNIFYKYLFYSFVVKCTFLKLNLKICYHKKINCMLIQLYWIHCPFS